MAFQAGAHFNSGSWLPATSSGAGYSPSPAPPSGGHYPHRKHATAREPRLDTRPEESEPPDPLKLRRVVHSAPAFGESSFTVLVGPEDSAKRFSLHKDLAVRESEFFEKAFSNGWKESKENVVTLPDHEAEHFQVFFRWLYTRRIFSSQGASFARTDSDEFDVLGNAWALGAYLQAPDFQDTVADAILEKGAQDCVDARNIHQSVYANSVAGAPIRKLVVDIAVWGWNASILEAQDNSAAWSDFFRDFSIALMKKRESPDEGRAVQPNCRYHEHHAKGGVCYKTKRHGFF